MRAGHREVTFVNYKTTKTTKDLQYGDWKGLR